MNHLLPEGLSSAGDPIEGNPFAVGDPRHQVWAGVTRAAEEEVARINAELFRSLAISKDDHEAIAHEVLAAAAKFDAWSRRYINVVWSDEAVADFDRWLTRYANGWLDLFARTWSAAPPEFPAEDALMRLRLLLAGRVKSWMAEARRYRAEQERSMAATPPDREACSWSDVTIRVTSDHRVQVVVKGKAQASENYAELGFADGRNDTEKQSWKALLRMAEHSGTLDRPRDRRELSRVEKSVQEIRRLLRAYLERQGFRISDDSDPIALADGTYRARFSISLHRAFDVQRRPPEFSFAGADFLRITLDVGGQEFAESLRRKVGRDFEFSPDRVRRCPTWHSDPRRRFLGGGKLKARRDSGVALCTPALRKAYSPSLS